MTCIQEVQEALLDIILPIVPVYFGESFVPVVRLVWELITSVFSQLTTF